MRCKRTASTAAMAAILVMTASDVWAAVNVSLDIPVALAERTLVDVTSWKATPLGEFAPGKPMVVHLEFFGGTGDMAARVVDEANLNFFRQGLPYRGFGVDKQVSPVNLNGSTWSHGQYFLLLNNTHAVVAGRQVDYRVQYVQEGPPEAVNAMRSALEEMYTVMQGEFTFADFNIHVQSCGQANAFSSPDITLCNELLSELMKKGRKGALTAIFLHEIGHTLLNVWGMPGFDNEDIADEFAAAVLLSNPNGDGGKALSELITWFSEQDSRAQAVNMLRAGDRHALSI
jgi:hypothetical protein